MEKELILADNQTIAKKIERLKKAKQYLASNTMEGGDCACEISAEQCDCACGEN